MRKQTRRWTCLLLGAAAAAAVAAASFALRAVNPPAPAELAAPAPVRVLSTAGPLDLNAASAQELEALPGVGPALAENLLAWREENGPFLSEEDVLAVPGIGPGIWERIRPFITF